MPYCKLDPRKGFVVMVRFRPLQDRLLTLGEMLRETMKAHGVWGLVLGMLEGIGRKRDKNVYHGVAHSGVLYEGQGE